LIVFKVTQPIGDQYIVYIYGVLALAVSVSVNLSWKFAHINKDLASQLSHVKNLSERTIMQERRAKEEEIQRRLLEADNERKTKELEEARQLQLSMLPARIPAISYLNIAAHMETASEVGGDYYDFHLGGDGTLTVVLGDATGHGIKAGTMVAAIKSLFGAFGGSPNIPKFFNRCSEIIKGMNLGNLYMAMQMVKIKDYKMVTSAAGMPPILIYRANTGKVEEVEIKGLPVGGQVGYAYDEQVIELQSSDIMIMMSDGYPELFNDKREMLDYERVKEHFLQVVQSSPHQIIRHLLQKGKEWSNGRPQNDDMTFVVIKVE
jgi:serine phosphatase RsbU (regulator of sigma subunit)